MVLQPSSFQWLFRCLNIKNQATLNLYGPIYGPNQNVNLFQSTVHRWSLDTNLVFSRATICFSRSFGDCSCVLSYFIFLLYFFWPFESLILFSRVPLFNQPLLLQYISSHCVTPSSTCSLLPQSHLQLLLHIRQPAYLVSLFPLHFQPRYISRITFQL